MNAPAILRTAFFLAFGLRLRLICKACAWGLAPRIWIAKIVDARKALLASDPRIVEENRRVIPRLSFELAGWPAGTDAPNIVRSVLQATGVPTVPTRTCRSAGVHVWVVTCEKDIPVGQFSLDIHGQVHQILVQRVEPVPFAKAKVLTSPTKSSLPMRPALLIQNAVIRALWAGRPKWRAKWLVQANHGQPHRIDPILASAVTTLNEVVHLTKSQGSLTGYLKGAFATQFVSSHWLAARFRHACDVLQLELTSDLTVSHAQSAPIILQDLSSRELKFVMKHIARQTAYMWVNPKTRKDVVKPKGLLDHFLSSSMLRKDKPQPSVGLTDSQRVHSIVVGCVLTNDRLAAAGWAPSALCRFCHEAKESMPHLLRDCTALHTALDPPVHHELGEIFEHPLFLARRRLLQSRPVVLHQEAFRAHQAMSYGLMAQSNIPLEPMPSLMKAAKCSSVALLTGGIRH